MKELTYFFGAGASCQAMPLVNSFERKFGIFLNVIEQRRAIKKLHSDSLIFHSKIKAHSTFDTFFKKLYHQNKEKEIDKYKEVLLFYFLFEHLFTYQELYSHDLAFLEQHKKLYKLDPRYEALIAGLLKPIKNKIDFYKKVNFLTWNYDVNLLNSLKNFIYPEMPLSTFISSHQKDGYFNIGDQIKVFHLNGYIAHPILDITDSDLENRKNSFLLLCKDYGKGILENFANNIKFAWEQNGQLFGDLSKVISSSSHTICIGYSFPLYNRLFDAKFFSSNTMERQELYIQNLETESVKSILKSDFKIISDTGGKMEPIVTYSTSCNSFIIPNDIFS